MNDEQKHAVEHAQKVLRAVKLYDLAAGIRDDARPVAMWQFRCQGMHLEGPYSIWAECTEEQAANYATEPGMQVRALGVIATRATAELTVWYGPMPESNGKTNWTAILHRGDISQGFTIDRSEYPDRVRYEADRVRWLIGETDKEPWILDYDADKRSDYVPRDATPSADARARVAKGLESCDWSGVPIGNKAIIQHAINLLRTTPVGHNTREAFEAWAMDFYGCEREHVDHFAGVDGYVIWQASRCAEPRKAA